APPSVLLSSAPGYSMTSATSAHSASNANGRSFSVAISDQLAPPSVDRDTFEPRAANSVCPSGAGAIVPTAPPCTCENAVPSQRDSIGVAVLWAKKGRFPSASQDRKPLVPPSRSNVAALSRDR